MIEAGHVHAWSYPIGMVYVEADYVVQRTNSQAVTEALLTQMAVGALFDKKAGKAFQKMVKDLS